MPASNNTPKKLFHYTIGLKLPSIFEEGFLRTSPMEPKLGEKPVVWLSKNKIYEKTALKTVAKPGEGSSRLMTLNELHEMGGGVFRFVFDTENTDAEFLPWVILKNKAKMPKKVVDRLLKRAKSIKTSPSDWFGTLNTLPVKISTLERLDTSTNEWNLVTQDQLSKLELPSNVLQMLDSDMPKEYRANNETWKTDH